jgi:hypothetical protein
MRRLIGALIGLALAAILIAVGAVALKDRAGPADSSKGDDEANGATRLGAFEDVTSNSGVDFTYRNGEEAGHATIFESLGGGVALFDYDGDGRVDIFVAGGGRFDGVDKKQIVGIPSKLYRNLGGMRFEDVTENVGLGRLAGNAPWF